MAYNDLAKIEDLVHHLWDAGTLHFLASGSLRYTDLHDKLTAWSGRRLSDSELTRTRRRLLNQGLITEDSRANGRKVYSITATGRARLEQIVAVAQYAAHRDIFCERHTSDRPAAEPGTVSSRISNRSGKLDDRLSGREEVQCGGPGQDRL
jgi:DNA-binding PadR family transcriptional regulator